MSGLVARNCPNLIKVVPMSCIELHNFSSSLRLSFLELFDKEKDKRLDKKIIIFGG